MIAPRIASTPDSEIWPRFGAPAQHCQVLGSRLGGGVALGVTRSGKPASVALLQPVPVRIAVVGQAWVASLLALRAACLGATVVVVTDRPAPWTILTRSVGGDAPFATVVAPESATLPPASVVDPVFVLHDGSASGSEAALARAPWQTSVHLLFRLATQPTSMLDTTDLILLPQPAAEELDATLELLRLPPAISTQIARMGETEFLAVTRSRAQFVTVQATPTEIALLQAR